MDTPETTVTARPRWTPPFNGLTRRQLAVCALAFVVGAALCTATLTFDLAAEGDADPSTNDCGPCFACLDEFQRCAEKRDNIKQGVVFGLGVAAVGIVGGGPLGSGVAAFGLGWAGAAYVHLLFTKCEPCHTVCTGCSAPDYGG